MEASRRAIYVLLLIVTVIVGLGIHFFGSWLRGAPQDILGDALWAAMIYWLVSLALPDLGLAPRAGLALAISFAVEFSQPIDSPMLEAIRRAPVGHLVIGSDYGARDLVAYAVGIGFAATVDGVALRGRRASAGGEL